MLDKILDYLKQPSTWAGTGIIAMIAGMYFTPDQAQHILQAGIAFIGLVEVFRNEVKK